MDAALQERRKSRFTRVAKREALQRASEVGSARVCRELNISASTLRSWRRRLASEPDVGEVVEVPSDATSSQSRAQKLRREADRAREAQRAAEDRADRDVEAGRSSEARNSAVVAKQRSETAREYEDAARAEEVHQAALARLAGEQLLELLSQTFAAVGLTLPSEVAQAVLSGREVPAAVKARAMERSRRELELTEHRVEPVGEPVMPTLGPGGGNGDDIDDEDDDRVASDEPDFDEEQLQAELRARGLGEALIDDAVERQRRDRVIAAEIEEVWSSSSEATRADYLHSYVDGATAKKMLAQDRRDGRRLDRVGARGRPSVW